MHFIFVTFNWGEQLPSILLQFQLEISLLQFSLLLRRVEFFILPQSHPVSSFVILISQKVCTVQQTVLTDVL